VSLYLVTSPGHLGTWEKSYFSFDLSSADAWSFSFMNAATRLLGC